MSCPSKLRHAAQGWPRPARPQPRLLGLTPGGLPHLFSARASKARRGSSEGRPLEPAERCRSGHPSRQGGSCSAKSGWLVAALLLVVVFPATAMAVEVTPTKLELSISVTEPTQGELQVFNPGSKAVDVKIKTGSYRYSEPGMNLPSCEGWIKFEPSEFTLAAGSTTTVLYTVQPPDNLIRDSAAEYVGAILVDQLPVPEDLPSADPSKPAPNSKVTIVPRLAMPVYVIIKGREKTELEISELNAALAQGRGLSKSDEPAPAMLRLDTVLKNTGSIHLRPSGTYSLFHADKPEGVLFQAGSLGKGMPVLPGTKLTLPTILPLPAQGRYRFIVTIESYPGQMLQEQTYFTIQGAQVTQEPK